MSDWPTVTLKDAGVTLIDCDHKTPKAQEEGLPYIGIPQLKEGRILLNGARLISEEDFKHWRRKAKPTPNDVILSRRCNPGVTAFVPEDLEIALGQNLVLLRADGEKLYPPYLRWVVQDTNWWNQISKFINMGAVFDSLKCVDIPKFEIKLPPMESQIKIAEILGSIDKKIEINRQTNQTLEHITHTIFKSWFVDFEPVKAKMIAKQNGQNPEFAAMCAISGKTVEQLEDLDEVTKQQLITAAALFPEAFIESELGEIPEGWDVKALDEIAHYQNGLALQKFRPENEEESLSVLKISQLKKGFADGAEKAKASIKPECIVDNGDVVFSWSGSLMVDLWCGGKVALNQHLFKVTSKNHPKWLYYYWTKHHLEAFQKIAADKAVTMGHIKREHLSQAKCSIPCGNLDDFILLRGFLEKQIEQRVESFNLQEIRNSLLPKLLSGEFLIETSKTKLEEVI